MEHLQRRHRFSYDTFVVCVSSPLEYSLMTLKTQLFYIATTMKSHPRRWYHERNWIVGKSKEDAAFFLFLFGVVLTSMAVAVKEFLYPLFIGL